MIITCPLCGAELESDVDIAIGQHVVCSFCERKFTYGADEASDAENADVSAAEAMHEDEFPDRFCWKSGAEIPQIRCFALHAVRICGLKRIVMPMCQVLILLLAINILLKDNWRTRGSFIR